MIIWNGWGILVAFIGFACLLLTEFTVDGVMQNDQYFRRNGWPKFVASAVAAIITWFVGRAFNRKRPGRELIDGKTGGGGHSLFFIPMEYWAVIFLAIGILALFA